jgi:hypothetical protein
LVIVKLFVVKLDITVAILDTSAAEASLLRLEHQMLEDT